MSKPYSTNKHILYVRTPAQREIFINEIQGQISDGIWENDNTDTRLWNCEVLVANNPKQLGCNFIPCFALDFCNEFMLDFLAERTINYARTVDPDYNEDKLFDDLNDLTKIVFG